MKDILTLNSICGGAMLEKVNRELHKVADNILDPNTDDKAKRKMKIEFTFVPDEENPEDVAVNIAITSSLAPERSIGTQFYLEKDLKSKKVQITEYERGQIRGQLSIGDMGIAQEDEDDHTDDMSDDDTKKPVDFRNIAN